MATLVLDTATAACSVALLDDDGAVLAAQHEVVGRGHAERLVPMVQAVLDGRIPHAILVDCGPGSFTGVRIGIAAARGLAIGWGIAVHGFSSTALLAAEAFHAHPHWPSLAVILDGGHGEVFMQDYAAPPLAALSPLASLRPEDALARLRDRPAVGSGVRHLAALAPTIAAHDLLPHAEHAALLPEICRSLPPRPIYGRAPDAKPAA